MDKKGFTLVELVVVLGLMSVIVMIAIPKLSIDGFYLDSVAEELVCDIRYVKNMDMAEPVKSCSIMLSNDLEHYDHCFYSVRMTENVMNRIVRKVDLRKGYEINYNVSPDIMFNANGTPKHAQTITILHQSTGNFREITIVPNTGRILLLE
jgi:prepilin-type N-terminal cleavage/methylation domain-containing protein